MSNTGSLDPLTNPTLRSVIEKAFEFEGNAVQNYNIIVRIALEINDFVTYNLAITVLADEVKDEQRTEDVHKGFGGKMNHKFNLHLRVHHLFIELANKPAHCECMDCFLSIVRSNYFSTVQSTDYLKS